MIKVRIENDQDAIVRFEVGITLKLLGNDLVRLGIKAADTEVDEIAVVKDAHFRALTWRSPFNRLDLRQIIDERRIFPHRFVQYTIDLGGYVRPHQRDARCAGGQRQRLLIGLPDDRRCRQATHNYGDG